LIPSANIRDPLLIPHVPEREGKAGSLSHFTPFLRNEKLSPKETIDKTKFKTGKNICKSYADIYANINQHVDHINIHFLKDKQSHGKTNENKHAFQRKNTNGQPTYK
jgi:hypothetical protein